MPRQPHWYDEYRAADFLGDLFDAVIEVTKTTPKSKEKKDVKKEKDRNPKTGNA